MAPGVLPASVLSCTCHLSWHPRSNSLRGGGLCLAAGPGGSNQVGLQCLESHTGKMASDRDPQELSDLSLGCTGQAVRSGVHLQTGMHSHTHC